MSRDRGTREVLVTFDEQLGQLRLGEKDELLSIDLLPAAVAELGRLQDNGANITLLIPRSDVKRTEWQLARKKPITVIGAAHRGGAPGSGELALEPAGAGQAAFVAVDRRLRGEARAHGWHPLPHLKCVSWWLRGETAAFFRVRGPVDLLRRVSDCLACHLGHSGAGTLLLAVMPPGGCMQAIRLGLEVYKLDADPAIDDLLLLRIDEPVPADLAGFGGRVLFSDRELVCVALGPDDSEDAQPLHGAHGHNLLVRANPDLLKAAVSPPTRAQLSAQLRQWSVDKLKVEAELKRPLFDLGLWTCPGSAAELEDDVRRYTGGVDPGGGPIRSRHSSHPDNSRAVDLLISDLRAMGYCPHRFAFTLGGRTLYNVIADLPGRGTIRVAPGIREKLRTILIRYPPWPPEPDPPWRGAVRKLGINEAQASEGLTGELGRLALETIFDLRHAGLWWRPRCRLAGCGAQLVILGCHLDSTAARDSGYDPATDQAPGVDDDASGIGATLAVARQLAGHAGEFRHTIRFCFFNGEEQGLVGSRAYAAYLKAWLAPVRAVICSDMIGYNSVADGIFEVHAGYSDPAIRDLSVPVAQRVADWAVTLGRPGPVQVYRGTSSSGGADRNLYDGAIGRSDHAAFHEQGYPAVVVSEDFFVNLSTEPGADPNPNYHRGADTTFRADYTADIACVIAQTVKELAQ